MPANDNIDRPASPRVRFQELAQVWVITHSLLLDRVCGTTYLSICVILNIQRTFLEFRRRLLKTHLFCWAQRRLVTVCFCAPYKSAFTSHYTTLQNIISFCHNPHVWQTDRQRGRNAYVTAGACISPSQMRAKIHSDIWPTPPANFTVGQKVNDFDAIFDPLLVSWLITRFTNRVPGCWNLVTRIRLYSIFVFLKLCLLNWFLLFAPNALGLHFPHAECGSGYV